MLQFNSVHLCNEDRVLEDTQMSETQFLLSQTYGLPIYSYSLKPYYISFSKSFESISYRINKTLKKKFRDKENRNKVCCR